MNRERLLLIVGFSLLAAVFGSSIYNIVNRGGVSSPGSDSRKVIRIGHWQLEPPVRAAYEELARVYMNEHPDVNVEVIAVPERIYNQWFMTRMVGGFAPDIVQLNGNVEYTMLARHLEPLGEVLSQSNNYNEKSSLSGVAWRDTFIDGLNNDGVYNPQLLDYYCIPVSQFSGRMIYNRTLWKELLGDTPIPASYAELVKIAEVCESQARKSDRVITPIASSFYHAPTVAHGLFSSQTQTFTKRVYGTELKTFNLAEFGLDYLSHKWSFDDPEPASGLALMRDVTKFYQPGFLQLAREDAVFYFLQGRALMLFTGNWDYSSYRKQASFELGTFKLPLPSPGASEFGKYTVGTPSEGETPTGGIFGLNRQSPHKDVALDFMRFMTSQRGNRIFVHASGWLPAVLGVEPREEIKPFYPEVQGVRAGFDTNNYAYWGAEAKRIFVTGTYLLIGPTGSVDAYRSYLRDNLPKAVRSDLARSQNGLSKYVQRADSVIGRYLWLSRDDSSGSLLRRKQTESEEAQNTQESLMYYTALGLSRQSKN